MTFLLRLIPEPWASAILVGAVLAAYWYGNTTGNVKGRYEERIKTLTQQNEYLTEDLKNASRVQSAIVREAEAARTDNALLTVKGKQLEEELKTKSGGACSFTDAERMRIKSGIKIGR